jgi:hypothetical protein
VATQNVEIWRYKVFHKFSVKLFVYVIRWLMALFVDVGEHKTFKFVCIMTRAKVVIVCSVV